MWDLFTYRPNSYTRYNEFWLDRPVTYHPDLRFIEVQSYSIEWIWRILTGQTCYIPPRSENYLGTHLIHILDMTNFEWTGLLHITQISDLLRYRAIPYTGYDQVWLGGPVTYHPDLRFIEVESYSIYWIWRILTGQTCYIPLRSEIYWCTDLFHTGYYEFWLDRPVTYQPDVRFIWVQTQTIYWIWRNLSWQNCYIPPRCDID